MLYVTGLSLIDSAEEREQWVHRATQQWGDRLLACRVRGKAGTVLGSTIPAEMEWDASGLRFEAAWLRVSPPEDGGTRTPNPSFAVEPLEADGREENFAEVAPPGTNTETEGHETGHPVAGTEMVHPDDDLPVPAPTVTENAVRSVSGVRFSLSHDCLAHSVTNQDVRVDCVGIDVSSELDVVVLEVLTPEGKVVSTTIVNISSLTEQQPIQHFALLVTPNAVASVDDTAIHGVLRLTVMMPIYMETRQLLHNAPAFLDALKFSPEAHVPTPIRASDSVTLSSTHMYFPSSILTGTGAYFVSNVLCIKSTTSREVSVELVVTGDSHLIHLQPSYAVLQPQGRCYFICTWNPFKRFTPTAEDAKVKIHVLIQEGGENKPPVDVELYGVPPRPAQSNPPFLLWVNMTMMSNIPCSAVELEGLVKELPVFGFASSRRRKQPEGSLAVQ